MTFEPSSFRDPSGLVFRKDGVLYRQIQDPAAADWKQFTSSGLYASLVRDDLLVEHEDAPVTLAPLPGAAAVIQPRELAFIAYPYEWCFSQLREAALLTLELQRRALAVNMRLKDASAYNVQFDGGHPILIDSLSFEGADPAEPWPAYRQFCQHFLAPLALAAYRDQRVLLMLREFIDGVPLDLAARLLPGRTRARPGLLAHLHLHARAQRSQPGGSAPGAAASAPKPRRMTKLGQEALLDNLRRTVEALKPSRSGHWVDYGLHTSYSETAAASKAEIVERMARTCAAATVWDLGANVGTYSGIIARHAQLVIAFDQDASSVEQHWQTLSGSDRSRVLPLVMDLANPSPALGWGLEERRSLVERGPADAVAALALTHHLAIADNVPLERIAALFRQLGRQAIVEFVPKEDPMVQRLLAARRDVFDDYHTAGFRAAFSRHFEIREEASIADSLRTVFRLQAR